MSGNVGQSGVDVQASKQVFNIKDLSTKSVVLYPSRAYVTRQIDNVWLKPGTNDVEIYGLSPTVDEHSIQIEGKGAATVADMTVQLVPNRDIFEETYPEQSDESDDESDDEYEDSDDDNQDPIKRIELKALKKQLAEALETQASASERLAAWDRYTNSPKMGKLSPDDMSNVFNRYGSDRATSFKIHTQATENVKGLEKKIARREYLKFKAEKQAEKEKQKVAKQKAKERRRKELQKAEKRKEANDLKQERMRYWPKKVYKVTLVLESSSLDTPGSSRRNSLDSITLASSPRIDEKASKAIDTDSMASQMPVTLLLSYVAKEAGWSPRYDLRISSTQKTATIVYRTEYLNRTSETWKDAKLSFSTSQTSYQGLDDVVPFMHAWHIKLSRYDSGDGGLLSPEENTQQRKGRPGHATFDRAELFGLEETGWQYDQRHPQLRQQKATSAIPFGSSGNTVPNVEISESIQFAKRRGRSFGIPSIAARNIFGHGSSAMASNAEVIPPGMAYAGPHPSGTPMVQSVEAAENPYASRVSSSLLRSREKGKKGRKETVETESYSYDPTIEDEVLQPENMVEFEETSWEDNGLTATYEVSGIRTLSPSSLTRRHKLASLHAVNIHLSHICVPKLRSSAFLRAKIRNPSSTITLLKGSAGVTLDGSFLGNMNLPRVSPGQIFDLPLGVDPAIHVNYPKPDVHRSTQGIIFNKESAQIFSRSIWLNNTKGQPIDLLVLDQVPVSEDERLRVGIVTPRGLSKDGDAVRAGVSAKEGSSGAMAEKDKKGEIWGSAVAKLKQGGEIAWTVKLEGGKACLLKLEYEARLPNNERIVPA